jgi:hypothetical protein
VSNLTYTPIALEIAYHIKWTLLWHIRYIVNYNKIFEDIAPSGLSKDHFYDALSTEYNNLPAFGIDYFGKRTVQGQQEDIFIIRYVGKNVQISPLSKYGTKSENERLLRVHDHIFCNFKKLSDSNDLTILKFLEDELSPRESSAQFNMLLLDSIPSRDDVTHSRVNALEFTYSIGINS